jgi:phosphate transport system protein
MTQIRGTLDRELAQIQDDILSLSSMVETATLRSVKALKDQDVNLARHIIADDEKINLLRYSIEEQCLTVIATQQPVAGDLRTVIAAMHIAVELERMGDHAAGIAELAIRLADEPLLKPLIDIPRMANIACDMLQASIDAFLDRDPIAAEAVPDRDDEVDMLDEQVFRELLTYMLQDPKNISRATYLLWVSHNQERTADRCKNISERVIFMTTGKLKKLDEEEID